MTHPFCFVPQPFTHQGNPKHTSISNTFDPTAFDTAISPYPSLITAIELKASGTLTPAKNDVKNIHAREYRKREEFKS